MITPIDNPTWLQQSSRSGLLRFWLYSPIWTIRSAGLWVYSIVDPTSVGLCVDLGEGVCGAIFLTRGTWCASATCPCPRFFFSFTAMFATSLSILNAISRIWSLGWLYYRSVVVWGGRGLFCGEIIRRRDETSCLLIQEGLCAEDWQSSWGCAAC